MARHFDQGSNESMNIDAARIAAMGTAFAIAFWIRAGNSGSDVFIYGEGNTGNSSPIFGIDQNASGGKLRVFFRNDGSGTLLNFQSAKVQMDRTWHHFIYSQDALNNVKLYTDGWFKETTSYSTSGTFTANTATLAGLNRGSPGNLTNCDIADLALFDRDLTDGEAIFLASGFSPALLFPVHYWPLNGGKGPERDLCSPPVDGVLTLSNRTIDPPLVTLHRDRKHIARLAGLPAPTSLIKTIAGVSYLANAKTVLGLARASVKTVEGVGP
jgi:hypothetical protein